MDLGRSFFYALNVVRPAAVSVRQEVPYGSIISRWRKKIMRTRITLACTECKRRNYNTTKDKKTHPERMEIMKYCRFCRKHTLHKETK